VAPKNYIWFQPDNFLCKFLNTIQRPLGVAIDKAEIATTRPTEIGEALFKRRNPRSAFWIILRKSHQSAKQPHLLTLLCACGEPTGGCSTNNCYHEIASSHCLP